VIVRETRKILAWLKYTLQDAEGHAALQGIFKESKRPKRYSSYVALMTKLIDFKPSNFEEATT